MFTGIVEELGTVKQKGYRAGIANIVIEAGQAFSDVKIGESIAVNGVCLTVIEGQSPKWGQSPSGTVPILLTFDLSSETIKRTTLGQFKAGDKVNLERSLRAADRLSGHFVTGHIDGTGKIRRLIRKGGEVEMRIEVPGEITKFIVEKGSVAIDGVSLTVVEIKKGLSATTPSIFLIYLIPHTLKITNFSSKKAGDRVNIETDILGKYIYKK